MVELVGWAVALVGGLPIAFFLIGEIEHGIRYAKETIFSEAPVCNCALPNDYGPLGSTYVCDDCAQMWYSTDDNVAWAGWTYAPWWKRLQVRFGWEKPKMRKVIVPPKKLGKLEIKALDILEVYKERFK